MNTDLLAELARRELARRYYSEYLAYAYRDSWIKTRLSSFLARKIQSFIESDTGHAYDILIIDAELVFGETPDRKHYPGILRFRFRRAFLQEKQREDQELRTKPLRHRNRCN